MERVFHGSCLSGIGIKYKYRIRYRHQVYGTGMSSEFLCLLNRKMRTEKRKEFTEGCWLPFHNISKSLGIRDKYYQGTVSFLSGDNR